MKKSIYLVDLVEDGVRNRCVFPFVALAFYVTLVLTLQELLKIVFLFMLFSNFKGR